MIATTRRCGEVMSTGEERVSVARGLYAAFERGDIEGIYELLDLDVLWDMTGPAEIGFFDLLGQHCRPETFVVTSVVGTANGVVAEGTETGTFVGHPLPYEMRWCHVMDIEGGVITRFTGYHDTAPMIDSWRS
jgi:ketosteroid isomerase-like protein